MVLLTRASLWPRWLPGRPVLPLLVSVLVATAFAAPPDEPALKAAFLRNFIEFVRWPQDRAELVVCAYGSSEASLAVAALQGQQVQKSVLVVRHIARADAVGACDAVYLPAVEGAHLAAVIDQAHARPILVVADIEGGAQLGATLSLHETGDRIGFDANHTAARAAGLRLGSRLLQLARRVH